MINIAILDDNKKSIAEVERLLSAYPAKFNYRVSSFDNPADFLKGADEIQFDIAFIDIVLGEKNGIETGKIFSEKHPCASIVFMSANQDYFMDVYAVSHVYFLVKEFDEERFFDALSKAVANVKREYISLETKNGIYKLNLRDILCFESNLKHVKIWSSDGSVAEYNINLKEIEALLPDGEFVRVHQSYVVNMRYIIRYDRKNVVLKDNKIIPVSRTYSTKAREEITYWLGEGL